MIDKRASYSDKNFAKHLKGLGLSEEEIKYILNETKRKKFDDGGSGDGGGDGGSSGGDGSSGDSGDGSSDGSGGGVGGDDGAGASNAGDAGNATGDSAGVGGSGDSTSGGGVGSGPGGEADTGGVSGAAASEGTGVTAAIDAVTGFAKNAITNAINNPVATALGMANPVLGLAYSQISKAVDAANRGVTAPTDYSQATESVQSGPSQSQTSGGGINTIQEYAPTYNPDTGNPTMDAYMRRLRVNLGLPV